jgi:hypothetical protein
MWIVVGAVAVAVAVAVAAVGLALGGEDSPTSKQEFQAEVVVSRDRVDFALGRLSKAQSLDEFLTRMDEAAAAIDDTAAELHDVTAPEELADEQELLVKDMETLARDVQGTADQARIPGFEDILLGAAGLDFESWDSINATLAKLREQGVVVPPLQRHTTS